MLLRKGQLHPQLQGWVCVIYKGYLIFLVRNWFRNVGHWDARRRLLVASISRTLAENELKWIKKKIKPPLALCHWFVMELLCVICEYESWNSCSCPMTCLRMKLMPEESKVKRMWGKGSTTTGISRSCELPYLWAFGYVNQYFPSSHFKLGVLFMRILM